jgi:hypothetical protein
VDSLHAATAEQGVRFFAKGPCARIVFVFGHSRTSLFSFFFFLLQSAEFDIKKEAAWAISNATSGGTAEQIRYLVDVGAVRPLCDLLTVPDVRIVTVALEGLENILKVRCRVSCYYCYLCYNVISSFILYSLCLSFMLWDPADRAWRAHRDHGAGGPGEHPEGGLSRSLLLLLFFVHLDVDGGNDSCPSRPGTSLVVAAGTGWVLMEKKTSLSTSSWCNQQHST